MTEVLDCVVVGAGVVGLAVARALALQGREVLVLERGDAIGQGASSRNSEIIHAGIYYPPGSLKARTCVRGRALLYAYCAAHGVAHRRLGKLIVAVDTGEQPQLERYLESGRANGVDDLVLLDRAEVRRREPQLSCTAALLSPSTGIIDSHAYLLALQADLEAHGGRVLLRNPVRGGRVGGARPQIEVGEDQTVCVRCRTLVNCAGLDAQRLCASLAGFPAAAVPACHYARGRYYSLTGRAPFSTLVYPLATTAGLGVHATLDLAGQLRFGPDVEWIDRVDYRFEDTRRAEFAAAIRRYYPGLDAARLQPGYTGIRPKLVGPGEPAADFRIQTRIEHGIEGLVNLFGIESPGLTASLALAEEVCRRRF